MAGKIRAMFIFEMLGRPPEFIKESMTEHVKNLEAQGIKVLSSKVHEPKPLEKEGQKGLFSTFSEVEIEFESINHLFGLSFRMLPSHIEVLDPSEINIKNFDLSQSLSELAIKLHRYDEVAKILTIQKENMMKQLNAYKEKYGNLVNVQEIIPENKDKGEIKAKKKIKKK